MTIKGAFWYAAAPILDGVEHPKPNLKPRCGFCRENGEALVVSSSHYLRDPITKQLTCPILRAVVCPICQATGNDAHTRSYCPWKSTLIGTDIFRKEDFFNMVQLKRTPYGAAGPRRLPAPNNLL